MPRVVCNINQNFFSDATRGLEVPPEAVREYVKSWKQQGSVYGVLEKISKLVSTRNRESASFMNVIASLDGSDTGAKHEKYFIKALTCMGYFVEYDQLTATQVDDEYDEESWQVLFRSVPIWRIRQVDSTPTGVGIPIVE